MKRREFIILTGVGATSSTLLSACGHPEEKLIPALIPDDQYVPGVDYWKASTCGMCPAGCGIIVRTREHKANKIEGNPLHPVNRGALCARGQAGLEVLYNPDRIKGPMKRVGERGDGKWEEISWDEAIKTLVGKMREGDLNTNQNKAVFVTTGTRGVTAHVANRLMTALGKSVLVVWPLFNEVETEGSYWDSYHTGAVFDVANSTYLLSFGARFLETWHSPVMYSHAYGEFRSGKGKPRGKFVQVEPRISSTAANADEWLPARPGTEGLVALAVAQVIVRERLNKNPRAAGLSSLLEVYSPENVAPRCDISADKLIRVALEFAKAERPLAIGSAASKTMIAINLLNQIVDNVTKPGGVHLRELPYEQNVLFRTLAANGPPFIQLAATRFAEAQKMNSWSMLMLHNFNPIYFTPSFRDDLLSIPYIVCFSSFMDETTELADLVLPDHSYLEAWDIHSSYATAGGMHVSLTQPVIEPQLNTRQTADVLLSLARELGGEAATALPFESAKDIAQKSAVELAGYLDRTEIEAFWSELSERAVVPASSGTKPKRTLPPEDSLVTASLLGALQELSADEAKDSDYPLTLMLYEHAAIGDGSFANLPALQELPDPMTSVMWGSWLEINPKTAEALGISDGDLVDVQTPNGAVQVPALSYPGIRPDVVAMPFGQGHLGYGRYATGTGANAASLLDPSQKGPRLETTSRARVVKVSGNGGLIRFGTDLMEHMESKR